MPSTASSHSTTRAVRGSPISRRSSVWISTPLTRIVSRSRGMDDASLFTAFQDTSLPADAFHHREHVRVAWMYVMRYGVVAALTSYSEGLKRFAAAKGKPQLYHETITWAYLLLIGE